MEGGTKVNMKTGEKDDGKKKKRSKKYKKGERLKELQSTLKQDIELIEEAERLAVSAPIEVMDPVPNQNGDEDGGCDQMKSIREAFDTVRI